MAQNFLNSLDEMMKLAALPDADYFAKNLGIFEKDIGHDELKKKVRSMVKLADKQRNKSWIDKCGHLLYSYQVLSLKWINKNVSKAVKKPKKLNPPSNYLNRGKSSSATAISRDVRLGQDPSIESIVVNAMTGEKVPEEELETASKPSMEESIPEVNIPEVTKDPLEADTTKDAETDDIYTVEGITLDQLEMQVLTPSSSILLDSPEKHSSPENMETSPVKPSGMVISPKPVTISPVRAPNVIPDTPTREPEPMETGEFKLPPKPSSDRNHPSGAKPKTFKPASQQSKQEYVVHMHN